MKCTVALLLFTLISHTKSARILAYFPAASLSHQLVFRPLTQELAKRGHEVVVITTDPAFPKGETPANLTEIDVHDESYALRVTFMKTKFRSSRSSFVADIGQTMELYAAVIDKQLNIPEVKNAIFGSKYDLLLLEATRRSTLGLSHVHNVPVIMVSSHGAAFGMAEAIGMPTHPFLNPSPFMRRIYNLTIWEKIEKLYNHYSLLHLMHSLEKNENIMLRKHFGNDMPPLSKLYNNIDMLFLHMHPIFESNTPVPPNVIHMWGINELPQQQLPQKLQTFLDSMHGVIYMSFGTNTNPALLPKEKIQMFLKVFCQLPYNVLWKWSTDELPGQCKNVMFGKWFPQQDLLRHPKLKLFVTHGGIQSTIEAISAGIPLVGVPMRFDQWYNVEKYVHLKIGVQLDLEMISEEIIKNALLTVLNDESYRENIRELNALMRDEPMGALDRAVWWVEYVLRHGGARHLRAPAHNISWWQYLEMELVVTLMAIIVAIFIACAVLIYFLSRCCRCVLKPTEKLKRF